MSMSFLAVSVNILMTISIVSICIHVCACACVRACVRACVCVCTCVRACVCACILSELHNVLFRFQDTVWRMETFVWRGTAAAVSPVASRCCSGGSGAACVERPLTITLRAWPADSWVLDTQWPISRHLTRGKHWRRCLAGWSGADYLLTFFYVCVLL